VRADWGGAQSANGLAARFGVSGEAMRWRLYSFDLAGRPP